MARAEPDKLLKDISNDDARALRSLFDQWYTPLCRHAATFVGDYQVAEDIVQELFIRLWANRKQLNISKSARNYLYRSVRNRCLNYIRDSEKYKSEDIDDISYHYESEASATPDEDEIIKKLHSLALATIRELPERCRVIFNLSHYTEMTNKEIAVKLSISEKTVENQITIALKKLRARLGPHLDKLILWFLCVNILTF